MKFILILLSASLLPFSGRGEELPSDLTDVLNKLETFEEEQLAIAAKAGNLETALLIKERNAALSVDRKEDMTSSPDHGKSNDDPNHNPKADVDWAFGDWSNASSSRTLTIRPDRSAQHGKVAGKWEIIKGRLEITWDDEFKMLITEQGPEKDSILAEIINPKGDRKKVTFRKKTDG